MAHICKERALGFIGSFGLLARLLGLPFQFKAFSYVLNKPDIEDFISDLNFLNPRFQFKYRSIFSNGVDDPTLTNDR